MNMCLFGHVIGNIKSIADFGGGDGYPASIFHRMFGVKPLVVDVDEEKVAHAREKYGLPAITASIESLPMADSSVDFGFCSHTVEHCREPGKALNELSRVVKESLYFVFPVESKESFDKNDSHFIFYDSPNDWDRLLVDSGLRPYYRFFKSEVSEYHVIAETLRH